MTATASPRLLPGDRLPDVLLTPFDGGARVRLHAEFGGRPLWLAMPADAAQASALPAPAAGVDALCLVVDDAVAGATGWTRYRVDAASRDGLGAGCLWVADGNFRLQERRDLPLHSPLPRPSEPPALDAPATWSIAPVLQIPGVFEVDLCAELARHLVDECGGGEPSRVVVYEGGRAQPVVDPSVKLRSETPPRDPVLEARMHERVMRRALPEIARAFNFAVMRRDPFKLLAYPAGAGYFRAHRDNDTPDVAHRRFALSVNLNAGDFTGGQFRFPEFGPHLYSPPTGTALVFSCSLLHEVVPVERGVRYAMTTFLA